MLSIFGALHPTLLASKIANPLGQAKTALDGRDPRTPSLRLPAMRTRMDSQAAGGAARVLEMQVAPLAHPKAKVCMKTYLISDGTRVKIGRSRNPQQRLSSLQTAFAAELSLLLSIDEDCEKSLHRRFAAHRLRGEWFTLHEDILAFAAEQLGFYGWLSHQVKRDDFVGDLARDAIDDKKFPRNASDYKTLSGYLAWHPTACSGARYAMALAFREWQRTTKAAA